MHSKCYAMQTMLIIVLLRVLLLFLLLFHHYPSQTDRLLTIETHQKQSRLASRPHSLFLHLLFLAFLNEFFESEASKSRGPASICEADQTFGQRWCRLLLFPFSVSVKYSPQQLIYLIIVTFWDSPDIRLRFPKTESVIYLSGDG